ncbi:unnamed protein product, partial [marine sediment metagenome]
MHSNLKPTDLKQKTIGIIGFGSIGKQVATICQSFQMKILVYDPYFTSNNVENLSIDLVSDLEDLFKKADIISIHVPYNKQTHHLVNGSLLKMARGGAILVNTSRG